MSLTDIDSFPTAPAWMAGALCAQIDPAIFFPEQGENSRQARAICATCPVTAKCLAWAMETGEIWGIYGGLTANERKRLRTGETQVTPVGGAHDNGVIRGRLGPQVKSGPNRSAQTLGPGLTPVPHYRNGG